MFHFTIRDVLWLTIVVALAVGWWLDQARISKREKELHSLFGQVEQETDKLNRLFSQIRVLQEKYPDHLGEMELQHP